MSDARGAAGDSDTGATSLRMLQLEAWRMFALYALAGDVTVVDFLGQRQLVSFVNMCELPGRKDGRTDAASVNVLFAECARGLMGRQSRASKATRMLQQQTRGAVVESSVPRWKIETMAAHHHGCVRPATAW